MSPYWADATIEGDVEGEISYEVHSTASGSQSSRLLRQVNEYISEVEGESFKGEWMIVGQWSKVLPLREQGINFEVSCVINKHYVVCFI